MRALKQDSENIALTFVIILMFSLVVSSANATVWFVGPAGDATTINGGIDLAQDGDTVLVGDGTYDEDPSISGEKTITVRGISGNPGLCIVNGNWEISDSAEPGCTISSMTVRGWMILEQQATLDNLIIEHGYIEFKEVKSTNDVINVTNCTIYTAGRGNGISVILEQRWPFNSTEVNIIGNVIMGPGKFSYMHSDYHPSSFGCGVIVAWAQKIVFCNNVITDMPGRGARISADTIGKLNNCLLADNGFGGFDVAGPGVIIIENFTMVNNGGYGLYSSSSGGTQFCVNSIIGSNLGAQISGEFIFQNSNVYGTNWDRGYIDGGNNIHEDPLFETGHIGLYFLSSDSPCIDGGNIDSSQSKFTVNTEGGYVIAASQTTSASQWMDSGMVDMGYHYSPGFPTSAPDLYVVPSVHDDGVQLALQKARYTNQRIILAEGIYSGPLYFHGKGVELVSELGPEFTRIGLYDFGASPEETIGLPNRNIYFHSREGSETIIDGLKVVGGRYLHEFNGGIYCSPGTAPTFRNCIITNCNYDQSSVGGLECVSASPTFENCVFQNNSTNIRGGAVNCKDGSNPIFTNCTFKNNYAYLGGSAIFLTDQSNATFTDCIFYGNSSQYHGGVFRVDNSDPLVEGCTIAGNYGSVNVGAVYLLDSEAEFINTIIAHNSVLSAFESINSEPSITCCNIFGNDGGDWVNGIESYLNSNNNTMIDPLFCDLESGNLGLSSNSTCGSSNPDCGQIGTLDVECGHAPLAYVVRQDGTGNFTTIQAAIAEVVNTDTIIVGEGEYFENIDYLGKDISIISELGPEVTIINGGNTGRVVVMTGDEGPTILQGFTITNGYVYMASGAGIICTSGSAKILNNIITDNSIVDSGSNSHGAGIYLYDCEAELSGNVIARNLIGGSADDGSGAAIYCYQVDLELSNNTITANEAKIGSALYLYNTQAVAEKNIIAFNGRQAGTGPNIELGGGSSITLNMNNIYGNAGGDWTPAIADQLLTNNNLYADPKFCDFAAGEYSLARNSLCGWEDGIYDLLGAIPEVCDSILTTYSVTYDGTGNLPTIQAAIDACVECDTVELGNGTFQGEGNRDLDFKCKGITICSASGDPESSVIDCQGSSSSLHRAFLFHSWERPRNLLQNVKIVGGYQENGGGILIENGSPTFENVVIEDCEAVETGGAFHIGQDATPIINGCILLDNHAGNKGGGVYSYQGDPDIINCLVVGNSANVAGGGLGAALSSYPARFTSCTISENTAPDGAGVYLEDCEITIENSIIAFNLNGNGLNYASSDATLLCCNIHGNAGGDWIESIEDQRFINNNMNVDPSFCDAIGGNFFLADNSTCSIQSGGACGTVGAYDVGCSGESSTYYVNSHGTGDFPNIQSAIDVSLNGDMIVLENGIYSGPGNRDLNFEGRGIVLRSENNNANQCIINCGGTLVDNHRGFIFNTSGTEPSEIRGVTIIDGYANDGAGIYCTGSSPKLTNVVIRDCISSSDGGGVYIEAGSSLEMSNCLFDGNLTDERGGGFFSENSTPVLADCNFTENICGDVGAGAYFGNSDGTFVTSCIFNKNDAGDSWGGGAFIIDSEVELRNCTFYGNIGVIGSGFAIDSGSSVMAYNVLVAFNVGGLSVYLDDSAACSFFCSDLWGQTDGAWEGNLSSLEGTLGNIGVDPLFIDADSGNLALYGQSYCSPEHNLGCGLIGALDVASWQTFSSFAVYEDGSGFFPTIQDAVNVAADGDTILLGNGVFTGIGNRNVECLNKGLVFISEAKDPGSCTIDLGGFEGFRVSGPSESNCSFEYITIRNGYNDRGVGGALEISGPTTTIKNCIFETNQSVDLPEEGLGGGAVYYSGVGVLTINDCIFSLNDSESNGGAVYVEGSPYHITNCLFDHNSATKGGAVGARMGIRDGIRIVADCTFLDNEADFGGAMLFTYAGPYQPTVSGCTIYGNSAEQDGGGIYCIDVVLELDHCLISGNLSGGAIGFGTDGATNLACCCLYGNIGGDWNSDIQAQLPLNNNTDADPQFCDQDNGDLTLRSGSPCAGGPCVHIGAYEVSCEDDISVYVVEADGSGSYETVASAIEIASPGDTILLGSGIHDARTLGNGNLSYQGKSIEISSVSGDASQCVIDLAGLGEGTARAFVFNRGEGPAAILSHVTIINGNEQDGGGIFIADSSPTLHDVIVKDCSASVHGGGIYISQEASPIISDCKILDNYCSGRGGGINIFSASATIRRTEFSGNAANDDGGGVYLLYSSANIDSCMITENQAGDKGGGLCLLASDETTISNSEIVNNSSQQNGSGVNVEGDSVDFLNCTIHGNSSVFGSGMSVGENANVTIENSLITENGVGPGVFLDGVSASCILICSNIYGNLGGDWVGDLASQLTTDNNTNVDPLYCNTELGDLTLHSDSPCSAENNSCGDIGANGQGCGRSSMTIVVDHAGAGDYLTIGEGLATAASGDTVVVVAGTYLEYDLSVGEGIVLCSETGMPDCVTIDAQQLGRVFECRDVANTAYISGFTVTGGIASSSSGGGGLFSNSTFIISNCIFTDNNVSNSGGALYFAVSDISLNDCRIENNSANYGGGLSTSDSSMLIYRCSFSDNTAVFGGGAVRFNLTSPQLMECTFYGNNSDSRGAIFCYDDSDPTISYCTFYGNFSLLS